MPLEAIANWYSTVGITRSKAFTATHIHSWEKDNFLENHSPGMPWLQYATASVRSSSTSDAVWIEFHPDDWSSGRFAPLQKQWVPFGVLNLFNNVQYISI